MMQLTSRLEALDMPVPTSGVGVLGLVGAGALQRIEGGSIGLAWHESETKVMPVEVGF